jgi:hypothetical protein
LDWPGAVALLPPVLAVSLGVAPDSPGVEDDWPGVVPAWPGAAAPSLGVDPD